HFFKPVILTAQEEYLKHREEFEKGLGRDLSEDYLDQFPQEDWPDIVASMRIGVPIKVSADRKEIDRLNARVAELEKAKRGYEVTERKRRKFAAAQRTRDKEQKKRRGK
ncbi:MAG: hypothetical protein HW414_1791, partial [Dehalococcoidia bacterium]|nr:hypothetical protein [Dehalococcoidia bacterium]